MANIEDRIKSQLERGQISLAKESLKEKYLKEDKADWTANKQAEYNEIYPTYILIEKIFNNQEEADEFINNKDFFNTPRYDYELLKLEYNEPIDYSKDESYVTFTDWLNETRVITEAIEEVSHIEDDIKVIDVEAVAEVTELVRPYVAKDVADIVDAYMSVIETTQSKEEAQAYLNSTDWYVARYGETGIAIPDDIKAKRAEARLIL